MANLTIKTNALKALISTAMNAISKDSVIASLSCFLIEASSDKLTLTASNSVSSIKASTTANEENGLVINENATFLFNANDLQQIVAKISEDVIELSLAGKKVTLKAGKSRYSINTLSVGDYPLIDFTGNGAIVSLKVADLKEIVKQTLFACADNNTRPALAGVHLVANNGVLKAEATNSYTCATKAFDIDSNANFDIVINAKTFKSIVNAISDYESVEMIVDTKKALFKADDVLVRVRLIEDAYPDLTRAFNQFSFTDNFSLNASEFLSALEKVLVLTDSTSTTTKNLIELVIDGGQMEIIRNNDNIGSFNDFIDIDYSGPKLTICFEAKQLIGLFKAVKTERVVIEHCNSPLRPFKITNDDDKFVGLVAAVRSY